MHNIARLFYGPHFQRRVLVAVWTLFTVLVLLKIHGSSVGLCAELWRPEKRYDGFVFGGVIDDYEKSRASPAPNRLRNLLATVAQPYRRDEFMIFTPAALCQFSHTPKFPLRNSNIGAGQNMLLIFSAPVWHPVSIVRPATWGYFFLGPERGLAWQWWFAPAAGFSVLMLVFNILLPQRPQLAALSAVWYCASAHVICWSNFPAYVVLFPALGFVALHRLLMDARPRAQFVCGLLLGLSLPGFFMVFHPPYQVSLGLFFAALFAGVATRDGLWQKFRALSLTQKTSLGLAVALTILFGALIWDACGAELKLMAQSEHFGNRVSSGGGISLPALFKGWFNYKTNEVAPAMLGNPSEAASFFHLFPAIVIALFASKRVRQSMDAVSWVLLAAIAALLFFMVVGVPEVVSKITLLSYVTSARADHALGLASIFLCVYLHGKCFANGVLSDRRTALIGGSFVAVLVAICGFTLQGIEPFSSTRFLLAAALLSGVLGFLLLAGRSRGFAAVLIACLLGTSFEFNPLCRGLDGIYDSHLAQSVERLDSKYAHPLWLCYGEREFGILVNVLGARSISGFHVHPQPALWNSIDPGGAHSEIWNRYGYVWLDLPEGEPEPKFSLKLADAWRVAIAPTHPAFRTRGAKLVLVPREKKSSAALNGLRILEESESENFAIFELSDAK